MIALKRLTLVGLLICLSLSVWAEDGVFILSKTKTLENGSVAVSEIYLTANKMLVKNSGSDNSSIIFDGSTEVFTFIDNKKKEYYQFDKPTLLQLKEQIKMMAKMMQQFAANMPAEQKSKFDQILNPSSGDMMTYKTNGKNDKIGSWKTVGYDGMNDGNKVLQMNIAAYNTLGVNESQFAIMKQMMNYFKDNLQEVVALLPTGGSFSQLNFDENSPILKDGIPVKTIAYKEGEAVNENIVESLAKKSISADQFNIPAGYKQQQINMQSMGR
ncbi:hypothetical protein SAMN04488029_1430 [Reichenbachiella faecimaris]|uniref:DUF4412 domain-containing protein n=1 Tax=Reichenbachiella faecimaris TaxID=692418 RepID=A0A1W2G9T4_REIFA|nr:hypothetical protein [Reichenbachiella faecimaris]SMD33066.1 hypothetical protein SAMN04488029_1430 [Reichenbachiella faecimaris]